MPWDYLSFAIIVAAATAGIYIVSELWAYKNIKSPVNGVWVFIAVLAVFTGGNLIKVAADGDLSQLPPHIWRIHLGIAGAFGIFLALQGLIAIFTKLQQHPARQTSTGDSPPNGGANGGSASNSDA